MLVAVNRPPGRGANIGIMLSGFDGSPGGLGLMDATSKVVAVVEAAVDDEGCCADTAVAASRAAKANALIERILFMVNLPAFSETD
jgi:hypothetical protein